MFSKTNLFKNKEKQIHRILFLLIIFVFLSSGADLSLAHKPQTRWLKQNDLYDLAVRKLYVDQQTCELHVALEVKQGSLPESVYTNVKIKIKSPSFSTPSISLNNVDPHRELNSKRQCDFNTRLILRKSETVEASLENIADSNARNNRQSVALEVSAHCQQRVVPAEVAPAKPSSQTTVIEPDLSRPRMASFNFKINDIAPPKTVYVYNYLPPQTNGSLKIEFDCQDREAQGLTIDISDVTSARNVLKTMYINEVSGRIGVEISELYQLQRLGEWRNFYFKARIKFRDGSFSSNTRELKVVIGFVNGYYYYQDYATRGIQFMRVNNSLGPVLVSGLTEDDREGRINITFDRSLACPEQYPVMGDVQLKFYKTHPDGRIITPQSGYTIKVPSGQSSYFFTMKNLIQSMGLSWSAQVYYISVETNYQCSSRSGHLPPTSEWDKKSNTVNIRFFVPQPLL